jgi:hypothetical protein
MTDAGKVAGEKLFNVFPDNPGDPFADGAANVFDSLRIVAETRRPHTMAVQRYDIRNAAGVFERYWRPVNSPVLDENGDLIFILNRVLDVTAKIPRRAQWRQSKADAAVAAKGTPHSGLALSACRGMTARLEISLQPASELILSAHPTRRTSAAEPRHPDAT